MRHDWYDETQPPDGFAAAVPGEPGPAQRCSTWDAVLAGQRGPLPRPDWVVTAAAALDTELGILKTGKEADVHLIQRAVPGDPHQSTLLAAKRYRGPERSDFDRSTLYTEGRTIRKSREARAVAKKTAFGRQVSALMWAGAEFDALCLLYVNGATVPYPVQVDGSEILMEFIGTGRTAAPRLAQVATDHDHLDYYFRQVVEFMRILAGLGHAHGDLSPYNLLVQGDRVVAIDLPQLVDLAINPSGMSLLERDCRNVCDWFTRKGLERDGDELFGELISLALS